MVYKMKMTPEKVEARRRESESMLRDLLDVLPKLKKHSLDKDLHKKIVSLRVGRRLPNYKLELTREYNGKTLTASKVIATPKDKPLAVKELKDNIRKQVQASRKSARVAYSDHTLIDGVTVPKMDEVYVEPGSFMKMFKRKIRNTMLKGSRMPNGPDNYVGIELEFASKKDKEFICDLLFENELGPYVCIKNDGSIGDTTKLKETHRFTHEIAVLAKQSEFEAVVDKLCRLLNDHCEVKVDKTCGLHVHVDMRNRDYKKAYANLVSVQHFLYAMCPAARKNSNYSLPTKGKDWGVSKSRYQGINKQAYDKYKTIEVRIHSGTTDATKITGWVRTILGAVDAEPIARAPSTTKGLQKAIGISDALRAYVESRICKFAKQHESIKLADVHEGCMPALPKLEEGEAPADTTVSEDSELVA